MSKALIKVENEILGQVIRDYTDNGYGVEIEDDSAIMQVYAVDMEKKPEEDGRYFGWVKFIWGNGADCISDYSTNLETIIKDSLELQRFYAD